MAQLFYPRVLFSDARWARLLVHLLRAGVKVMVRIRVKVRVSGSCEGVGPNR
jgi:hypothetical protein